MPLSAIAINCSLTAKGASSTDAMIEILGDAFGEHDVKLGETIRIRFMNEGMQIHPMHLHGLSYLVIAKDGYPQPQPWECDTLNVAPGERWDVTVLCDNPGTWAFHCHILSHAESEKGMFGMVNVLVVAA